MAIDLQLTNHDGIHVFGEVGPAEPSVPVVGDVSPVHDLPKEVPQVFPWDLAVRLQVVEEDADADREVPVVVGVDTVPALRTELPALADNCVEVAESEEDALELSLL